MMKLTLTALAALMFVGVATTPTDASAHSIWRYSSLRIEQPRNVGFAWLASLRENRFDWRLPSFYAPPRNYVQPLRFRAYVGRRNFVYAGSNLTMVTVPEVPPISDTRPNQRPIPEPSAALAFGLGLMITGAAWRRR